MKLTKLSILAFASTLLVVGAFVLVPASQKFSFVQVANAVENISSGCTALPSIDDIIYNATAAFEAGDYKIQNFVVGQVYSYSDSLTIHNLGLLFTTYQSYSFPQINGSSATTLQYEGVGSISFDVLQLQRFNSTRLSIAVQNLNFSLNETTIDQTHLPYTWRYAFGGSFHFEASCK